MAVMLVILLNSTWNHAQLVFHSTQPSAVLSARQHVSVLLSVKVKSGTERFCCPSEELHSTKHQKQRERGGKREREREGEGEGEGEGEEEI